MTQAEFVIVKNADIDEDISDFNFDVALKINNQYFYVSNDLKKSDAINLAASLNTKNNLN
jgi:hypothetical protein